MELYLILYIVLCVITFAVRMWDIRTSDSDVLRHMDDDAIISGTILMSIIPIMNIWMLCDILYEKFIKTK